MSNFNKLKPRANLKLRKQVEQLQLITHMCSLLSNQLFSLLLFHLTAPKEFSAHRGALKNCFY